MPLPNPWFELNENSSDLNNVISFIEKLPDNLEKICEVDTFKTLLNNDKDHYQVDYSLFEEAFNEAKKVLKDNVAILKDQISHINLSYQENLKTVNDILNDIGFTGASLKLKARLLNKLWDGVISAGNGIISFTSNPIIKALKKFLTYLNNLLGSLKTLLPGIDAFKEIKEVIESYLDEAEE
ncbi:hypothetical protein HDC90_003653 [Pedobacter sp. AK013]|uniref:hypothetical protein n=1 Tax=Pedobacter sp. AK013 TaxID=2723071 RepID=UPI00160C34A9|nr:hypothetical protein [Pedobacter sp. AK013]MBB6239006.1 hypothetical protein [Pedobacter sp. AK013]